MGDRELLEWAAKAVGRCLHKNTRDEHSNGGTDTYCTDCGKNTYGERWNPLTNDGEVLRLATKLRIWLKYGGCSESTPAHISAHYLSIKWRGSSERWVDESYVPEEMFVSDYAPDRTHAVYQLEQGIIRGIEAATRRAIVRAAAEIGKSGSAASGQGGEHG